MASTGGETVPVRVVVRLRHQEESEDGKADAVSITGASTLSLRERPSEFSACYGKEATTARIWDDEMTRLLEKAMSGFNCLVLGYGARSSGKARTLFGGPLEPKGLIALTFENLFDQIERSKSTAEYFVTVSVYHVREQKGALTDLLNPRPSEGVLHLQPHRTMGLGPEPVAELEVTSAQEGIELVGQAGRTLAALAARSPALMGVGHTFIDLAIDSRDVDRSFVVRQGGIRFVCTHGSGGAAIKGMPSLQALNEVVAETAAGKPPEQVNFGQHSLSRLLEQGLAGNAITLAMIFVSALERNAADTQLALEFGERLRGIRTVAKSNVNTVETAIRQLRQEITRSKERLNLAQPRQFVHDLSPQALATLKGLTEELARLKKQTWPERKQASSQMKAERIETLRKEGLSSVRFPDVVVDEKKQAEANAILERIADAMAKIQRLQIECEEKEETQRSLRKLKQKKMGANAMEDGKEPVQLQKINMAILKCKNEIAEEQSKLRGLEEDYRARLMQLLEAEGRQRMYDLNPDAARVLQERELQDWKALKASMDKHPRVAAAKEDIRRRYEAEGAEIEREPDLKGRCSKLHNVAWNLETRLTELEFERNMLWTKLLEHQYRSAAQMERYQQHMFFVFRDYRSHFEQQKLRVEGRYRELLEDSVRDALRLAEENARLKAELAAATGKPRT